MKPNITAIISPETARTSSCLSSPAKFFPPSGPNSITAQAKHTLTAMMNMIPPIVGVPCFFALCHLGPISSIV